MRNAALILLPFAAAATARAQDLAPNPMGESTAGAHADGLVDTAMGSFSYRVPIAVPGYFGITPDLSLGYASSRDNGPLGVGWELSVGPIIERASAGHGLPTYGESDVFLLNGIELVACEAQTETDPPSPSCVATGESGSPRRFSAEIEDYRRIRFFASDERWEITRPDGVVMVLRPIFDVPVIEPFLLPPGVTRAIWRYGLSEVRDLHGHRVTYVWSQRSYPAVPPASYPGDGTGSSATLFPQLDRIEYAGGHYRIELFWEDALSAPRPDPIVQATGSPTFHAVAVRLRAIAVKERGNLIAAYQLRYVTTGATGRSKLSEVQAYGSDATVSATGTVTGGSSYAPYRFRYVSAPPIWREQPSTLPFGGPPSCRALADVDGNGLADVIVDGEVHLNQGDLRFEPAPDYRLSFVRDELCGAATLADLNGDRRPDRVHFGEDDLPEIWEHEDTWQPSGTKVVYLNTGRGFRTLSESAGTRVIIEAFTLHPDMNGDGTADAVSSYSFDPDPEDFHTRSVIDENRIVLSHRVDDPAPYAPTLSFSTPLHRLPGYLHYSAATMYAFAPRSDGTMADVNADGAADFLTNPGFSTAGAVHYNAGGFFVTERPRFAQRETGASFTATGPYIYADRADFDRDGYADMFTQGTFGAAGHYVAGTPGGPYRTNGSAPYTRPATSELRREVHVGDLNGDGFPDFVEAPTFYGLGRMVLSEGRPELLIGVTTPAGAELAIEYEPSWRWDNRYRCDTDGEPDESSSVYCAGLPDVIWTPTRLDRNDGRGNTATTRYAYSGGLYDRVERRFLGFRYVREVLPQLPEESRPPCRETWFQQDYGSVVPLGIDVGVCNADGTAIGTLLSSTRHVYIDNGSLVPRTSHLINTWHHVYDGTGTCMFPDGGGGTPPRAPCPYGRRTLVTRDVYDGFGNVRQTTEHGDYDVLGDELVTGIEIRPATTGGRFLTSLVAAQVVTTPDGTRVRETQYRYDENGSWDQPPALGELRFRTDWHDRGAPLVTEYHYNADGLLDWTIAPGGSRTDIRYDAVYGLFEAARTNHLGHTVETQWSYRCQAPSVVTDANDQDTTTTFDALCRVERVDRPLGGYVRHQYVAWNDPRNRRLVTITPGPADGPPELHAHTFMDGLGRTYMTSSPAVDPFDDDNVIVESEHGLRGAVRRTTLPHHHRDRASKLWVESRHDALDRPVEVIAPDTSGVRTAYTHDMVTVTDQEGHRLHQVMDGRGRVAERREERTTGACPARSDLAPAASCLVTRYLYGADGELERITDPAGNEWRMEHDSLGRRYQLDDPDAGRETIAYDDAGRPWTITNQSGEVTTVTYDRLDRPTRREVTRPGGGRVVYEWRHDEPRPGAFNVGRITTHLFPSGETRHDHDAAGRPASEQVTIDGAVYARSFTYDRGGRLEQARYPRGDLLHHRYDDAGRLFSIGNGAGTDHVHTVGYDAAGHITLLGHDNGVATSYAWSAARGWLDRLTVNRGTDLLRLDYAGGRDRTGRITRIQESGSSGAATWSYGYDAQNRLTSASGPGLSTTVRYDDVGNIVFSSDLGDYRFTPGSEAGTWTTGPEWPGTCGFRVVAGCSCNADFNGDGSVDAADYIAYRRNEGRTGVTQREGDADCDGDVDDDDYGVWQAQFGMTRPASTPGLPFSCPSLAPQPMPHAVRRAGEVGYCYDASGRMTASSRGRRITWTPDGRPGDIDGTTFGYDGQGTRLWRRTPGGRLTHYPFGDAYEVDVASGRRTLHVSIGGGALSAGPVFELVDGAVVHHHLDHQGSVRLVTDSGGTVVNSARYRAYGETLSAAATRSEPFGFTGQRRDPSTGLFYLHARYYDPVLGRFLSPDPTVPTAALVGLNRYAYAYDDPVNLEDRNGLAPGAGGGIYGASDAEFVAFMGRWGVDAFVGDQGTVMMRNLAATYPQKFSTSEAGFYWHRPYGGRSYYLENGASPFTRMHELGHFWQRTMEDLGGRPRLSNAAEEVRNIEALLLGPRSSRRIRQIAPLIPQDQLRGELISEASYLSQQRARLAIEQGGAADPNARYRLRAPQRPAVVRVGFGAAAGSAVVQGGWDLWYGNWVATHPDHPAAIMQQDAWAQTEAFRQRAMTGRDEDGNEIGWFQRIISSMAYSHDTGMFW